MADKPLEEKDKVNQAQAPQAGAATPSVQADFSQASIGAYNPQLTAQNWEKEKKPWNSTAQGRLAIRLFSRGVMGAAFFTAGNLLNHKWMRYYDHTAGFHEQKNPLAVIAKILDTGVGKPVEWTVRNLTKDEALARQAVTFRPTAGFSEAVKDGKRVLESGRSLGHEVVNVTFDFFCASIGDAWGRDIAGFVDPNVRSRWIKDGHIDIPGALKNALKATWRYVTYNGGEDWAVAIPYCYYMKGQRAILNKFTPGFGHDFDRTLNGGSMRVDDHGHVTGNYNKIGILDLQNRFVVYNMGTLMYRELYDFVGRKLKGKHAVLYGSPELDTGQLSLGEKTTAVFKWMARSVVKAGIYMTPAVPFFWLFRTPQTKFRGAFINPEKGYLATGDQNATLLANNDSRPADVHFARSPTDAPPFTMVPDHPVSGGAFDAYARSYGPTDAALNQIGKANIRVMNAVQPVADLASGSKKLDWAKKGLGVSDFTNFKNVYVNAAFSYTPYMYAKAEFSRLWDDGKMDLAAERMIDGAAQFNWGEFKSGAGEVWRAILHKPLKDPVREAEAKRRLHLDRSPPDGIAENIKDGNGNGNGLQARPWHERVVQGDRPEVGANSPKTHAEREEMREALKNLQPPTNSIN